MLRVDAEVAELADAQDLGYVPTSLHRTERDCNRMKNLRVTRFESALSCAKLQRISKRTATKTATKVLRHMSTKRTGAFLNPSGKQAHERIERKSFRRSFRFAGYTPRRYADEGFARLRSE